jgi:hypothetical protein
VASKSMPRPCANRPAVLLASAQYNSTWWKQSTSKRSERGLTRMRGATAVVAEPAVAVALETGATHRGFTCKPRAVSAMINIEIDTIGTFAERIPQIGTLSPRRSLHGAPRRSPIRLKMYFSSELPAPCLWDLLVGAIELQTERRRTRNGARGGARPARPARREGR